MRVGTKSLLFGVHQFLYHPLTVALAWKRVYTRWPNWWECVAICCHDLGYWGKRDMDGPDGITHPYDGARYAWRWTEFIAKNVLRYRQEIAQQLGRKAWALCITHSYGYCARVRQSRGGLVPFTPGFLAFPDKVCVLYDQRWFYLLRARLSGEIYEFMRHAPAAVSGDPATWLRWYRSKVHSRLTQWDRCRS